MTNSLPSSELIPSKILGLLIFHHHDFKMFSYVSKVHGNILFIHSYYIGLFSMCKPVLLTAAIQ